MSSVDFDKERPSCFMNLHWLVLHCLPKSQYCLSLPSTLDVVVFPTSTRAEIVGAFVCKVTFKHPPQPQTLYPKFRNPRTTFEPPPCPAEYCTVWGFRGVPNFFGWWISKYFRELGANAKYQNPGGKVTQGERKKEREKRC